MTDFIKQQQEKARKRLMPKVIYADRKDERVAKFAETILEAFWVEQQKDLDTLTAQIIKNTCERVRSQIKHSPQIEIEIEQVKNARAIEIKYIEDIINNITKV